MGYEPARALAAVRLSLSRWSTTDEIDRAADLLTTAAITLLTDNGAEATEGAR